MEIDRDVIDSAISSIMDDDGIQATLTSETARIKLEHYVEQVRNQAIGITHAWACMVLDAGKDPRDECVPSMLDDLRKDLAG